MGISNKEKIALMREYLQEIREKRSGWQTCFICKKSRFGFITIEQIPMPVCKDHVSA